MNDHAEAEGACRAADDGNRGDPARQCGAVYYGHTAQFPDGSRDPDERHWQLLSDHLLNVADGAKTFAAPFRMAAEAELAGQLHDLGKYATRFQERLRSPGIRGINHWSIGAFQAWELGRASAALAIEGHHTGLPALRKNHDALECWTDRYKKLRSQSDAPAVNGFPETLCELLKRFEADGFRPPGATQKENAAGREFGAALAIRMLFSSLVDADFLDTEKHFDLGQASRRNQTPIEESRALRLLLAHLDAKPAEGTVNQLRNRLRADCLHAAERPPGLFTLTAPTGSGKTLASLAFALRHIEHNNAKLPTDSPCRLRRIIAVIPYTSIIEQTAAVYRGVFQQEFGPDYVLEHHSSVAPREQKDDAGRDAEEERIRRARLASENWDAPLVVTTSVQFFESLFSNRPSDCRRLHNIARSVVLFDEVQTLPRERVPSLLSAVRHLTEEPYGTTAVLMTATQPAFGSAAHVIQGGWQPTEISSDPGSMAEAFKRVEIIRRPDEWQPAWSEVAQALCNERQCLVVVNTKAAARALFQALPREDTFHLSGALCPAHRREKLAEIRRRLDPTVDGPCRLVSTQLIEAGVDVDFPVVWRALGPLDSIIQTAGRCNREGRLRQPGRVTIFRPAEHNMPPGAYSQAAAVTESFLAQRPDAALHRPETYAAYFRQLYGVAGPQMAQGDALFKACEDFDFPLAAELCGLIGQDSRPVLVRWKAANGRNRGHELAEKLTREKHFTASECREAQQFSVNLYHSEFLEAQAKGYIYQPAEGWDFWVWNSDYDEDLGLGHLEGGSFIC